MSGAFSLRMTFRLRQSLPAAHHRYHKISVHERETVLIRQEHQHDAWRKGAPPPATTTENLVIILPP